MDNNIDGYLTRKMKASHGISRLTLGEIGNRVSAITIDTSKGGAIKKEILQPTGGVLANAQSANIRIQSTACDISTNNFNDIKQLPQRTQILKAETVSKYVFVSLVCILKYYYKLYMQSKSDLSEITKYFILKIEN